MGKKRKRTTERYNLWEHKEENVSTKLKDNVKISTGYCEKVKPLLKKKLL